MSSDIWYVSRQIMPPSQGHSARVRAEIFQHAARLFRLRGYAGTNIDDIMLAAGLTRGAFYAHFRSKDDLFAEVIGAGHGLLARMRAGDGKVRDVLDGYLAKDGFTATLRDCTLAALAGDVARAPLAAQLAYANVLHGLIGEMARGRGRKLDADATAAVRAAGGAVSAGAEKEADEEAGAPASFAKAETIPVTPESRCRSSAQTRCTITR
jgi:TetR/AcrR family transcriptional repressor of nem operon